MGLLSSSKKDNNLILVFDVGSSSVGGALFLAQKSKIPKIIFSIREPILIEGDLDVDRLFALTLKTLKNITSKICLKGLGTPSKVFCVLSSPWYASQTRTVQLKKNTPFVFTSKLADELIQKELHILEEENKTENKKNEIIPIELKNMKIILNGYLTKYPLGQKAKILEMDIFISVGEKKVIEGIKKIINRHFNVSDIKFSSLTIASFAVARDFFVNQDNFLLINIGGEVTDISMIKKESLRESLSYPAGSNFVVRGIAKEFGCTIPEALSYISLYKDGHLAESTLERLKPIMKHLKRQWLKKFQESLSKITKDISVPSTIFITVDQNLSEFFSEIIKTEEFSQYTLTESKFRVFFLGPRALHGITIFNKDVNRDSFLIIDSIYINNFLI